MEEGGKSGVNLVVFTEPRLESDATTVALVGRRGALAQLESGDGRWSWAGPERSRCTFSHLGSFQKFASFLLKS